MTDGQWVGLSPHPRDEMDVTISLEEYAGLQEDRRWRQCVENAGVDNWPQFHYAMEEFYGDDEDE